MTMTAPLDLQYLLVNTFAGSTLIFIGIALLMIAMMSGKFRLPNSIFGLVIVLFGVLMMSWAGWLYVLILIIGGLIIGYTISRLQR